MEMFLLCNPKICYYIQLLKHHVKVLFPESSVCQIYFDLANISKNQISNFQGFIDYCFKIEKHLYQTLCQILPREI